MTTAFTFREFDVPDALEVTLKDDDAPFGRREEEAGFESGGEHHRKRVKLPGRRGPLIHMLYADDRPLVVRGRFMDYRMGAGHAKAMRALIERVRERGNLLRIVWDGDQWQGVLAETTFGHEGNGYLSFELTFDVALPPDTGDARTAPTTRGDSDALARVIAKLRAKPSSPAFARNLISRLDDAMTIIEDVLGGLQDATRSLEVARDNITGQVRRVTSLGAQVQQQAQALQDVFDRTMAAEAGIVGQVEDVVAWSKYGLTMSAQYREVWSVARDTVETARARLRETEKLYVVRAGDTLESIARSELGDAARAGELGLMDADLVPGLVLRLPPSGSSG